MSRIIILLLATSSRLGADEPSAAINSDFYIRCVEVEKMILGGADLTTSKRVFQMITEKPRELDFIARLWWERAGAFYIHYLNSVDQPTNSDVRTESKKNELIARSRKRRDLLQVAYMADHWQELTKTIGTMHASNLKLTEPGAKYLDELRLIWDTSGRVEAPARAQVENAPLKK